MQQQQHGDLGGFPLPLPPLSCNEKLSQQPQGACVVLRAPIHVLKEAWFAGLDKP